MASASGWWRQIERRRAGGSSRAQQALTLRQRRLAIEEAVGHAVVCKGKGQWSCECPTDHTGVKCVTATRRRRPSGGGALAGRPRTSPPFPDATSSSLEHRTRVARSARHTLAAVELRAHIRRGRTHCTGLRWCKVRGDQCAGMEPGGERNCGLGWGRRRQPYPRARPRGLQPPSLRCSPGHSVQESGPV